MLSLGPPALSPSRHIPLGIYGRGGPRSSGPAAALRSRPWLGWEPRGWEWSIPHQAQPPPSRLPPAPSLSPQPFRALLGDNSTLCPWRGSPHLTEVAGLAQTLPCPLHCCPTSKPSSETRSLCEVTAVTPITKLIFWDRPLLFPLHVSSSQSLAASRLITLSARLRLARTAESIQQIQGMRTVPDSG